MGPQLEAGAEGQMERVSFRYDVRSAAGSGPAGSMRLGGGAVAVPAGLDGGATPVSVRVSAADGLSWWQARWLSWSAWRRRGWKPVLLAQPFLRKLLHGLALLVRRRRVAAGGFFSPGRETIGLTGCLGSTNLTPRGSDSSDRGRRRSYRSRGKSWRCWLRYGFCL